MRPSTVLKGARAWAPSLLHGVWAQRSGCGTSFYNTPARMKFLKKDSSEGTFVADIVAHVALSHPAVRFKFVREGKVQYVTPGDGQLRSAVYAVLGREFSRSLLELDDSTGPYRLWGLIDTAQGLPCQPEHAIFLHQWTQCAQPHDDGRFGRCL